MSQENRKGKVNPKSSPNEHEIDSWQISSYKKLYKRG